MYVSYLYFVPCVWGKRNRKKGALNILINKCQYSNQMKQKDTLD